MHWWNISFNFQLHCAALTSFHPDVSPVNLTLYNNTPDHSSLSEWLSHQPFLCQITGAETFRDLPLTSTSVTVHRRALMRGIYRMCVSHCQSDCLFIIARLMLLWAAAGCKGSWTSDSPDCNWLWPWLCFFLNYGQPFVASYVLVLSK